jgi:hypothetical protein
MNGIFGFFATASVAANALFRPSSVARDISYPPVDESCR